MIQPKQALRQHLRALLKQAGDVDTGPLQAQCSAWLLAHPDHLTIAAFAALPGEPDLLPLIAAFPERRWVLPRVEGEHLTFHHIRQPEAELATGAFGIREPQSNTSVVAVLDIDVFLCPGLAFDARGGRLGRGRGFYDRLLENARPNSVKIGVCHPFQFIDDVHPEAHDIAMDEVFWGNAEKLKR